MVIDMLLTIDIGNTNITMGIYEGDELLFTSRLATDRKRTSDQYSVELLNILNCIMQAVPAFRVQ